MMRRARHRSFIIVAVMVITGSALFVASGLLYALRTDAAHAAGAQEIAQARALAWSGMQVIMAELHRQRERILDGQSPTLNEEYVIYDAPDSRGVVRLLPAGSAGELLISEAGKLDLSTIDGEALKKTTLIDPATAEAIISHRDSLGRPIQSIAELLAVEGVTPELLYGPLDELNFTDLAQGEAGDLGEQLLALHDAGRARGLADILTVYAFEPALQQNGKLRINLNVEWSDELRRRVAERFDDNIANALQQIFEQGYTFDTEAKLYQLLINFNVEPREWHQAIDTFTAEPNHYHRGRLDVNTAPYEALLALPGFDADIAIQCVDERESLAFDERASMAWPAILEIVEPAAYNELGGRITTRAWTWRIWLAAGVVDHDDPEAKLQSPVIYEAVIDLSAPRPRVAYLRDITLLQTAASLVANFEGLFDPDDVVVDDTEDADSSDEPESEVDSDADGLDPRPDTDERALPGREAEQDTEEGADRERSGDESDPEWQEQTPPPRRVGRWRAGD